MLVRSRQLHFSEGMLKMGSIERLGAEVTAGAYDSCRVGANQMVRLARWCDSQTPPVPWPFAPIAKASAFRKALLGQAATYGIAELKNNDGVIVEHRVCFQQTSG